MVELPTWVTYVVPLLAALLAWFCKARLPASVTTQIRIAIEAILRELNEAGDGCDVEARTVAAEAVRRVEAAGATVSNAEAVNAVSLAANRLQKMF